MNAAARESVGVREGVRSSGVVESPVSRLGRCIQCGAKVRPDALVCPVCGGLGRCPCGHIADLVHGSNGQPKRRRCWRCDEGNASGGRPRPDGNHP